MDSPSDFSGSLKISNGEEREAKDSKATSSDLKDIHDEQVQIRFLIRGFSSSSRFLAHFSL